MSGVPNDYYVDPSLGSDTGDGSKSTPWGRASGSVIQYALDNITRDVNNGDRINVKAGTADQMPSGGLSTTTYGLAGTVNPLIVRGYTTDEADGGKGDIDCNGNPIFSDAAYDYINFHDLDVVNTGSALTGWALQWDRHCTIVNCKFTDVNTSNTVLIGGGGRGAIVACSFISCEAGTYIVQSDGDQIYSCHWEVDSADTAVRIGVNGSTISRCTVWLNNTGATGISLTAGAHAINNSIFNNTAGTEAGIGGHAYGSMLINNLIEGFSGTGGQAIDASGATNTPGGVVVGNRMYNCTTEVERETHIPYYSDNESLSASPFADAANKDFAPANTGSVIGGHWPATPGQQ